jgi:nicotinamidase-related amidase
MKLAVEIEVPEPRDVHLDPGKAAIVVIDMENEFCAPAGKKFIGSPAEEAVRAVATLIERGRQAGVSVLWVRSVRERDALEFTAFKQDPPPHRWDLGDRVHITAAGTGRRARV